MVVGVVRKYLVPLVPVVGLVISTAACMVFAFAAHNYSSAPALK